MVPREAHQGNLVGEWYGMVNLNEPANIPFSGLFFKRNLKLMKLQNIAFFLQLRAPGNLCQTGGVTTL